MATQSVDVRVGDELSLLAARVASLMRRYAASGDARPPEALEQAFKALWEYRPPGQARNAPRTIAASALRRRPSTVLEVEHLAGALFAKIAAYRGDRPFAKWWATVAANEVADDLRSSSRVAEYLRTFIQVDSAPHDGSGDAEPMPEDEEEPPRHVIKLLGWWASEEARWLQAAGRGADEELTVQQREHVMRLLARRVRQFSADWLGTELEALPAAQRAELRRQRERDWAIFVQFRFLHVPGMQLAERYGYRDPSGITGRCKVVHAALAAWWQRRYPGEVGLFA